MPSLGADMDAGTLLEWLVRVGDTVHRGDPVAVVDTDKSAIEVESFDDGVVESLLVEPGTRVAVGTPLASFAPLGTPLGADDGAEVDADVSLRERADLRVAAPAAAPAAARRHHLPAPPLRHHAAELGVDLATVHGTGPDGAVTRHDVDTAAASAAAATSAAGPAPLATPADRSRRVTPYARRLARELGVDLAQVTGSGPDGSVRAADVLAARSETTEPDSPVSPAAPAAPQTSAPPRPATPPVAPGRSTRTTIAALMSRAKREIPHYYVASTVDLHELTEWLRRTNRERPVSERIVPAAAILKATALSLREHPELNGFWVGDEHVPGEDVHLGVAVSVRDGALVAPALHHAADLSLPETMAALRDVVKRARSGRLRRAELADPTFTVTDLGDLGAEEVIGVIYPPQVGLLGVGRIVEHPWAVNGLIGVRPTVRLTLSGDHRATDGATGSRFLTTLDRRLQHPEEL